MPTRNKSQSAEHYKKAIDLEAKGKIQQAIDELEMAVSYDPLDGNIYNRLGDLYIKTGKKEKAITVYKKGINAYRDDTFYRSSLALCKKVLKYDPTNVDVYPIMGKLLVELDAKSDALTYLFEYVERQQENQDVESVIETLDYMKGLGIKDKAQVERMMEIYKSIGRTDRADLLVEKGEEHKPEDIKLVFDRTINILLVEDDEDDYIITKEMLEEITEIKFKLERARTYTAGLEFLMASNYDVCLLDYHLGEKTGLDLLRAAIEQGCTLPVILLTGQGGRQVDLEAMYAGAADYLVKGKVDAVGLERSIRYAIERNLLLQALRKNEEKLRAQVVRALALTDALTENQKKLHTQATHDDLTNLFNRRHFMEIMDAAITDAVDSDKPLCLCIGDIDHFKEINDQYGHQMGDQVLATFSHLLNTKFSKDTVIGRYGGDEFCILFPLISTQKILPQIEQFREEVSTTGFKSESGEKFNVKASFGIAEFTGKGTQRDIFRLADKALYEAKEAGRNRTVVKKL
ncbi:diguanylate cyclase [candidate division WOR-3 bacterium]|nr:diguanylate cyclase [candidate division WOR-3 bacterium]